MTGTARDGEERNPFAPPASELTLPSEDPEAQALPRPAPLQRLVLLALGFLMPLGAWILLVLAGSLLASRVSGHQGTALVGAFGTLLPFLLGILYLPYALIRLKRTSATLPMRILGYRFISARGGAAGFSRIWFLWWLPGLGLPLASFVVGLVSMRELPGALLVMGAGPALLVADLLGARRASRRTFRDQLAGLVMVKP